MAGISTKQALAICLALIVGFPAIGRSGNAQWRFSPTQNDWNTAGNWLPNIVPNGSLDTATFADTVQASVIVSQATEVSRILFTPNANSFTITVNPEATLTISGTGVNNLSTVTQTLRTEGGTIVFSGSASAESATLIAADSTDPGTSDVSGGQIVFNNQSTGDRSRIEIFGNGTLDISAHVFPGVQIGTLEGDGKVLLGSNNLTVGSVKRTTDFTGIISEGPGPLTHGSLTIIGTGFLALAGNNTFTGPTTIFGGGLNVGGSLAGPVIINGGEVNGLGSVGPVTVNNGGSFSPGEDTGQINVNGDLIMSSGSTYVAVLFGTAPVAQYTQANVTGSVALNNATLRVRLEYFPHRGDKYTIIKNDGADRVKGKFAGLREGGTFVVDGRRFKISYKGGGGNDVVITATR